jgi:hypothetical protein
MQEDFKMFFVVFNWFKLTKKNVIKGRVQERVISMGYHAAHYACQQFANHAGGNAAKALAITYLLACQQT